jgi:hypothetical protein
MNHAFILGAQEYMVVNSTNGVNSKSSQSIIGRQSNMS